MSVSRTEVLKLYKNLLIYSKSLRFTDVAYYKKRIANEFKNNKNLKRPEDIEYAFKVHISKLKEKRFCSEVLLYKMLGKRCLYVIQRDVLPYFYTITASKHTIDYSKVPKINECDLSEQFVRGGGPGGSAVNKNANCVVLTHVPSGTVIKCHISRCQDENRKLAREMLTAKLDDMLNGEESITAQKKKIEAQKHKKIEYKKRKKAQLKDEWRKREGLM